MKHYMDEDYVYITDPVDEYTHHIDISMAKYLIDLGAQAQRELCDQAPPNTQWLDISPLQVLKDSAS